MSEETKDVVILVLTIVLAFLAAYKLLEAYLRVATSVRRDSLKTEREIAKKMCILPVGIPTPVTLHGAIQNGMNDPTLKIYGPALIELHVKDFIRQKFCVSMLRAQDPDQERLISDLAKTIGILSP